MIDIKEIMEHLPHRYPFLLIDRVLEFEEYKSITALKNVSINEPFFNGHFPGEPVMPGVLMIEALAQAAGILLFKSDPSLSYKKDLFVLVGVDDARFKKIVRPGDQLIIKIELLRAKQDVWKFKGEATVDGQLACSAELINARSH